MVWQGQITINKKSIPFSSSLHQALLFSRVTTDSFVIVEEGSTQLPISYFPGCPIVLVKIFTKRPIKTTFYSQNLVYQKLTILCLLSMCQSTGWFLWLRKKWKNTNFLLRSRISGNRNFQRVLLSLTYVLFIHKFNTTVHFLFPSRSASKEFYLKNAIRLWNLRYFS